MDQGVGREVKRLREQRDWSQAKLAVEAKMSVSGVSMIENGQRNLTTTTLAKLANAFDIGIAELFPKAQVPLPINDPESGTERDPAWAAGMVSGLADTAAGLARAWNHDVEFYEQHGRSLFPDRTLEMGLAVEALYRHFWDVLSVLQRHAESLGLDPNPATWEPQYKELLIEAGSNIRALAELYSLIDRTARKPGADREDFRARREEFNMGPAAGLSKDPQWPEAMERARTAAGIA